MPFPLSLLPTRDRQSKSYSPVDGYDSSSSTDSAETTRSCSLDNRDQRSQHSAYAASTSASLLGAPDLLLHHQTSSGRSSISSTASSTPIPSRSSSPLPQFYPSGPGSAYTSDADSEPISPLSSRNRRRGWWNDDGGRWWVMGSEDRRRRRRRDSCFRLRSLKRVIRMVTSHPFFPMQPTSIILTLFIFTIFATLITLLLMHILNPDKEPLPWRAYCAIPATSTSPPSFAATPFSPTYPSNPMTSANVSDSSSVIPVVFPPNNLNDLPPAGVFIGVFSMDSAVERRMLVRSTWVSHIRSRNGAGAGDNGLGTSRTIVRFVLGRPRKLWERRIQLEAETYNDMIVLPITENMNSGKTHAFFTWASTEAWVPPLPSNLSGFSSVPDFSYSNETAKLPLPVAKHDPSNAQDEYQSLKHEPWVRPDFVVKVDDDSFVMLAELEARLRLELHVKHRNLGGDVRLPEAGSDTHTDQKLSHGAGSEPSISNLLTSDATASSSSAPRAAQPTLMPALRSSPRDDPLVYWGYLVKNQFMAGELYALSWSIVGWISQDPMVKGMTKGKEDKQVAKWMRQHPRAEEVRWRSERCWIYDHPRAGTVYSHGFLFPSEVTRIKKNILTYLNLLPGTADAIDADESGDTAPAVSPVQGPSTLVWWTHSTVATFGTRYTPPLPDLPTLQSVEALVEGSEMSGLREGDSVNPDDAWLRRDGRLRRYEEQRVGGTVVVHFIKKNPWYLETALALLEGEDTTAMELTAPAAVSVGDGAGTSDASLLFQTRSNHHRQ